MILILHSLYKSVCMNHLLYMSEDVLVGGAEESLAAEVTRCEKAVIYTTGGKILFAVVSDALGDIIIVNLLIIFAILGYF